CAAGPLRSALDSGMSARTSALFQQRREFFERVHQPSPIFLPIPCTRPGHSSRMSRFEFALAMDTKRGASVPASPNPPVKPRRTFTHDILMAEKAAEERARKQKEELVNGKGKENNIADWRREDQAGSLTQNVPEGGHFGISASKMISRYEQLASVSDPSSSKKFVRRPDKLNDGEEKIVKLSPINGNYCTILDRGSVSPLTPCQSPILLKSVEDETEGPYFQFRIRRRKCIREKDAPAGSKRAEGEQERIRRKKRAVVIRKHTLEQIKKQNEELLTATKPMLFETGLIISIERIASGNGSIKQQPKITFIYGQYQDNSPNSSASNIPYILYPDAPHATPLRRGKVLEPCDNSFFVALTDETGVRTFAYCIKFEPATSENEPFYFPSVFALITRIRDPSFYFELARRALHYTDDTNKLKSFLKVVHDKEHPRRGGMLIVEQRDENGVIERRSEICTFGCEPKMRMGWSVDDLVRQLTPEWTTCIIAAVLAEQRVLITGSSVHEVTRAVQAIDALLRPLEWPFCLIPCIPDNIVDYTGNPSPYLIGILRHNLDKIQDLVVEESPGTYDCEKNQSDFALFDIDRGLINPIPLTFKNHRHFDEPEMNFRSTDEKERETHLRMKNCVNYCKRVGMPRKVAKGLVQLLYKGLDKEKSAFDVETCTEAMLCWYASIFGHYKSAGVTAQWDKSTKATLLDKQQQPSRRDYLECLVESTMFNLWIERRQKVGDRFVCPTEELQVIDAIFEQISETQNYKRKKPVKHAFGKLFGSSKRN
ncbi:hypothetical protein PENTCL1PPCAC_28270, partial [Pristionchus entomophagus]